MTSAKEQFMEDVRQYVDAGERLVAGVEDFNERNRVALGDLENGMSLTESFAKRDGAEWSRALTALLDDFEAHRKQVRESAATALYEEGRSVREIGAAFGASRQWANRLMGKRPRPAERT